MTHPTTPPGAPTDPPDPEYHLPAHHWPLPEMTVLETHPHPTGTLYQQVRASADFQKLRRAFRSFAFPTVVAVIVWYLFYVVGSVLADPGQPSLMGTKVLGNLTLGMLIGLLQFPTTWLATWFYVRRMNTTLDPLAKRIREQIEAEAKA